jgi:HSP20 family protein
VAPFRLLNDKAWMECDMSDTDTSASNKGRQKNAAEDDLSHPLTRFRAEMDRLFDDLLGRVPRRAGRGAGLDPMRRFERVFGWGTPAVDLVEKDDAYVVSAELPGLDERDIDVTVTESAVTLKGEKKEDEERASGGFHISERQHGSFQRTVRLPEDVDPDQVSATFKKGVLTVTCLKRADARKRHKKIDIKAE